MTTLEAPRPDVRSLPRRDVRSWPARWTWSTGHVGLLGAAVTFLLRLPGLAHAPGADEAGFLVVAKQWAAGGSSLYGNYWVDRPPLLITIFRFAALHGGLVTLRVVGAVAAALTVWGVARVTRSVVARSGVPTSSAVVSAVLAATAWLVTPLTGSQEVNGELLAAPFVVWGIAAAVAALAASSSASQRLRAALAGMCAVAAVLVKQNFPDVVVFAGLALLVALLRREVSVGTAARLASWFAGGAAGALALVAAWTAAHGTSIAGVYWAMYPFRVIAGQLIAASGNTAVTARLGQLGQAWLFSGLGVVTVGVTWLVLRRLTRTSTVALALGGLVAFDMVSILLGGSYWLHYLVQLVVPLSILLGIAASHGARSARLLVVPVLASSVLALGVTGGLSPATATSPGSQLGRAVAAASRPGDTIVTLYGHSDVTQQSGLASPYRYLWSLPLKTLDPHLTELSRVLAGPTAPTWVVTWAHVTTWGVDSSGVAAVLARDYHPIAVLDGHTVYVRNDDPRPVPVLPTS